MRFVSLALSLQETGVQVRFSGSPVMPHALLQLIKQ